MESHNYVSMIVSASNRVRPCVWLQVQILSYNSDLYGNMTQAIQSSNGLVMLALLVKVVAVPRLRLYCRPYSYQTN